MGSLHSPKKRGVRSTPQTPSHASTWKAVVFLLTLSVPPRHLYFVCPVPAENRKLCDHPLALCFLRQHLQARLISKSKSCCLGLPHAGISGARHHTHHPQHYLFFSTLMLFDLLTCRFLPLSRTYSLLSQRGMTLTSA